MKQYKKGELTAYVGYGEAQLSYGKVINPTAEMLERDGYEYVGDGLEPTTYSNLVETLIRRKYSVSGELAILRQQTEKPEEYQAYYEYCEACKKEAKEKLGVN